MSQIVLDGIRNYFSSTLLFSHGAEVTTEDIFQHRGKAREAMMEVYHPTKENTRDRSSPLLTELLSKPVPLKKLCREVLRKTLRILTGGRTIQPLVAELEKTNFIMVGERKMPLPESLGNFLLCDPSGTWREKMVTER